MVLIMVTGIQIRAALGILGWSVKKLADEAEIGTQTVNKFKSYDGLRPRAEYRILTSIKDALNKGLAEKNIELEEGGIVKFKADKKEGEE